MPSEVHGLAPLLQGYDMPTSIHFYRDGLGFTLINHAPGRFHGVLLRLNGAELMLNTKYEFDDPRPPKHAVEHDIGLYFGCPDVEAAYRHICKKGITATERRVAPYGRKHLYIQDPDGFSLCCEWPV